MTYPDEYPDGRTPLPTSLDRILRALVIFIYENRYQPSFAELAKLCGRSSVQRDIDRIAACGWIKITGRARAIDIPEDVYNDIIADREIAKQTTRKKR